MDGSSPQLVYYNNWSRILKIPRYAHNAVRLVEPLTMICLNPLTYGNLNRFARHPAQQVL